MPQIKPSLVLVAICLAGALALSGCGDQNSQAVSLQHDAANWLPVGHKSAATGGLQSCFDCHGENLDGGISKVSCTSCHLGDPSAVHPLQWGQFAYARHKDFVGLNGTASCANAACHGLTLAGVAASGPACATACHLGGAGSIHPQSWTTPLAGHSAFVTANGGYDATSCSKAVCHGSDYKGKFLSGPSCYQCHPADPTDTTPLPDKHPHKLAAVWMTQGNAGFHGNYLKNALTSSTASCLTSLCHGAGGTGPSCSTPNIGCHQ